MRMGQDVKHSVMGAIVVALIVLFMGQGYTSNQVADDRPGYELIAKYRSIDGIAVGSAILMAGIQIGTVTAERFDTSTNNAILTFRIDDDIVIPYDSVAMIVSDGILGGKYVKIAPGGDFDNLADGDQFEYVQDAVVFEELLEKVITAAEQRRLNQKAE